ncbi:hypothetical protein ACFSR7_34485 [Cohnella sp. GCM10020058]|uniref:hypothetical protein n=1 Tax=Cohnella sp. GCM10020058 TaxID=3317330 RepID=UPI0036330471
MNGEGKQSLLDFFKAAKDIALIITFLIYFSGFLFVNAKYSVFINDFNTLDVISSSIPTALDIFLKNGIYISLVITICYVLAIFCYNPVTSKKRKSKKAKFTKLMGPGKRGIQSAIELVLIVVLPMLSLHFSKYNTATVHCTYFLVFFLMFIWLFRVRDNILNAIYFENTIIKNVMHKNAISIDAENSYNNGSFQEVHSLHRFRDRLFRGTSAYYFLAFFVFMSIFILSYGASLEKGRMLDIARGHGTFKMANIYYDNSPNYQSLFVLDISKELLIGFQNKKAIVVPLSKTTKVDLSNVKLEDEVEKLEKNQNLTAVENEIIITLKKYYDDRLINKDSENLLSYITDKWYKENYNSLTLNLLAKRWRLLDSYNGHPSKDYIGVDFSKPIKTASNIYEVFAVEVWKGQNDYIKFLMKLENGSWKIDRIYLNQYLFDFK